MAANLVSILIIVTFAFVIQPGVLCAHWPADFDDVSMVYTCQGVDLLLPWDVTPDSGEEIIVMTWFFTDQTNKTQVVAMSSHGIFFPYGRYLKRVEHVPTGGLRLSHVMLKDEGNYTLEVNLEDKSGAHLTRRHTVIVHVATMAQARIDATMKGRQAARVVFDSRTGQHHVLITCKSQGRQPSAVIWTTPSQEVVNSSQTDDGDFRLLLPNPVSGGNYTCRLPADSPAARCLPRDDPALSGGTVFVDAMDARLQLLEAGQAALRRENDNFKKENVNFKKENSDLKQEAQKLKDSFKKQTDDFKQEVEKLKNSQKALQTANSDLKRKLAAKRCQSGVMGFHNIHGPRQETKRINFSPRFATTPVVMVALSRLDVHRSYNLRVVVNSPSGLSATGFHLTVYEWADSHTYSANVAWIACA